MSTEAHTVTYHRDITETWNGHPATPTKLFEGDWVATCSCGLWTHSYRRLDRLRTIHAEHAAARHQIDPGERVPGREEHNAVQGQWDEGQPGNAAPMPATTTATPAYAPLTGLNEEGCVPGACSGFSCACGQDGIR